MFFQDDRQCAEHRISHPTGACSLVGRTRTAPAPAPAPATAVHPASVQAEIVRACAPGRCQQVSRQHHSAAPGRGALRIGETARRLTAQDQFVADEHPVEATACQSDPWPVQPAGPDSSETPANPFTGWGWTKASPETHCPGIEAVVRPHNVEPTGCQER